MLNTLSVASTNWQILVIDSYIIITERSDIFLIDNKRTMYPHKRVR